MNFDLITTSAELDSLVQEIKPAKWLALDTEFMRESTYYPKLCLIQVATENVCSCIDVFQIDDIEIFIDELRNPDSIKIFHSARQDLEVLFNRYQVLPTPLFDTQIAASLLQPNEQISYGDLVAETLSIQLAKSQSRTDWSRRPLSAAQIAYALDDVRYLGPLYQHLDKQLKNKNRLQWLEEEAVTLCKQEHYIVEPSTAWKNVKGVGRTSVHQLPYVKQLAAWREETAQTRDLPRQWILPDRAITDIAQLETLSPSVITHYLETEQPKVKKFINTIVELMNKNLPDINAEESTYILQDRRLSKQQQEQVKRLLQFVRQRAEQIGATSSLLANRKSIERLVRGENSHVTQGWRAELFGNELLELLATSS